MRLQRSVGCSKLSSFPGGGITIDSMGCQIEIAKNIIDEGADYCSAAKDNQPILHDGIIWKIILHESMWRNIRQKKQATVALINEATISARSHRNFLTDRDARIWRPYEGGAHKLSAIEPDQAYKSTVDFGCPTGNVFLRRHCFCVEISNSYFPYFLRSPNTGGDNIGLATEYYPANQTNFHDAERPS